MSHFCTSIILSVCIFGVLKLHEARAEDGKARRGGNMGKWVDDLQQPFNLNSEQPSVVKVMTLKLS